MRKAIWVISTTHMFLEVFYFTQVALIPVLIQEFRLTLLEASLVATVPNLISLLVNIPSGLLADRFSANRLLFASMTIEGISVLIVSQTHSYWVLILALCLVRIASPLYHASGLSQIARIAEPEKLNVAMGLHNALGDLGTAAGVGSLAIFLSILNWRWAYVFWAVPILIWGIVVLKSSQLKTVRLERRSVEDTGRLRSLSPVLYSAFLIFLIAIGARELGSTAISTFMTTYLVDVVNLSGSMASLIFSIGAFVGIVGSLAGGYLGQRLGSKKALSFSILACAVSLSFLAFASHLYVLTLVYLAYAFFDYAVWSPMHAMVAEITPEASRGLSYSVYLFVYGLMFSIAPLLAAAVIQSLGIWVVFPLGAAFLVAAVLILQLLRHPHASA
jgi:FSR family fosmidomycin resistance protein-like MFS transporter